MEFTYNIIVGQRYSVKRDEYDYDEREITFEPSDEQLLTALADILISETKVKGLNNIGYKAAMVIVKMLITENDILEALAEKYKEELKDYFKEDAEQEAKDLWR